MRQSQVAVLSALGLIVLCMILMAGYMRVAVSQSENVRSLGDQTSESANLSGFEGVSIGDNWSVSVERGENWSVRLSYPEGIEEHIDVHEDDGILIVNTDVDNFDFFGGNSPDLSADIVMPQLVSIRVSGAAGLAFSGFESERLDVRASGAARLEGRESRYGDLSLRGSGAARVDLRDVIVTDADVRLSGAANARIAVEDGSLSGTASGGSRLEYYGTPREQNVERSGGASIDQGR